MEKLDVLYVLGNRSQWSNNEIRYSLRSLERFFTFNRVFIVGYLPNFVYGVIHIPMNDIYEEKGKNVLRKIKYVCKETDISDRFVLMNDDFFFTTEQTEIKNYITGSMQQSIDEHPTKRSKYYFSFIKTRDFLQGRGIEEPLDFEVHCPIVFEKSKFLEMARLTDFLNDDGKSGYYLHRSLFGNLYLKNEEKEMVEDCKYEANKSKKFNGTPQFDFLSFDDVSIQEENVKRYLVRAFAEKSRFEKDNFV